MFFKLFSKLAGLILLLVVGLFLVSYFFPAFPLLVKGHIHCYYENYREARDCAEDALLIDPYNMNAIRLLDKIYKKLCVKMRNKGRPCFMEMDDASGGFPDLKWKTVELSSDEP